MYNYFIEWLQYMLSSITPEEVALGLVIGLSVLN